MRDANTCTAAVGRTSCALQPQGRPGQRSLTTHRGAPQRSALLGDHDPKDEVYELADANQSEDDEPKPDEELGHPEARREGRADACEDLAAAGANQSLRHAEGPSVG